VTAAPSTLRQPRTRYKRTVTIRRNLRAERLFRKLTREHELVGVPTVMLKRYCQLAARSAELDTQARELRQGGLNNDADWQRWTFLVAEFRRYAATEAQLYRVIFSEACRPGRHDGPGGRIRALRR
jgi:hypothetical protein